MAQLCGIPFSTVNQIEAGRVKNPSAIKVKQIAVGLGVSVDYLLSDI
jgi:transcriptional regulator with XRE-family HTH domain